MSDGCKKQVAKLTWKQTRSTWSGYTDALPYTDSEQAQKVDFVRRVTHSRHWPLVWDLGCNTGTFSRIAAENADYVLAMDVDALVIERLYCDLKQAQARKILPLISNVVGGRPCPESWLARSGTQSSGCTRGRPT